MDLNIVPIVLYRNSVSLVDFSNPHSHLMLPRNLCAFLDQAVNNDRLPHVALWIHWAVFVSNIVGAFDAEGWDFGCKPISEITSPLVLYAENATEALQRPWRLKRRLLDQRT